MKRARSHTLILSLLLLIAVGCSPTKRWAAAREGLTAAQDTARTSTIKPTLAQIRYLDAGFKAARELLVDAEKQLPAGGPSFDANLRLVRSVIDQVAAVYRKNNPLVFND